MSFVPILVALGTSCAFELKRAASTAKAGPAVPPNVAELKASEARLKKLLTVRERERGRVRLCQSLGAAPACPWEEEGRWERGRGQQSAAGEERTISRRRASLARRQTVQGGAVPAARPPAFRHGHMPLTHAQTRHPSPPT
jgi:hypothetical protein